MQGKANLIPSEVINREVSRHKKNKDWNQLARLYRDIRDFKNMAKYHVKGIHESLEEGNIFSDAYYIKELFDEMAVDSLFEIALKEYSEKNDFHGQMRSLQELGWKDELNKLLISNEDKINSTDNIMMKLN